MRLLLSVLGGSEPPSDPKLPQDFGTLEAGGLLLQASRHFAGPQVCSLQPTHGKGKKKTLFIALECEHQGPPNPW